MEATHLQERHDEESDTQLGTCIEKITIFADLFDSDVHNFSTTRPLSRTASSYSYQLFSSDILRLAHAQRPRISTPISERAQRQITREPIQY